VDTEKGDEHHMPEASDNEAGVQQEKRFEALRWKRYKDMGRGRR